MASKASTATTTDSDSELSDPGEDEDVPIKDAEPQTPTEQKSMKQRSPSSTSIAKDVIANRGQYGRFASQWFSKQGWRAGGNSSNSPASSDRPGGAKATPSTIDGSAAVVANRTKPKDGVQEAHQVDETAQAMVNNSVRDALPKILRTTKIILTSGSFFFSYDFDLTRRLALLTSTAKAPSRETLDPLVSPY